MTTKELREKYDRIFQELEGNRPALLLAVMGDLIRYLEERESNYVPEPKLGPPNWPERAVERDKELARTIQAAPVVLVESSEPKIRTLSGRPIDERTCEINPATGMQNDYIVLCPEERARGFVRPYRDSYKHVGQRPRYPLRELSEEERERHKKHGVEYVAYEEYPESASPVTGRFWMQAQLNSGCGTVTTMGRALAETYARDPKFYGATYCAGCRTHFPVNEFVWTADGQRLGS